MVELGLQPQQPGSREQVLNLSALNWVKPERTFSKIKCQNITDIKRVAQRRGGEGNEMMGKVTNRMQRFPTKGDCGLMGTLGDV